MAIGLLGNAKAVAAPGNAAEPTAQVPAPAPESKKKAMEHFETGLKLYEDGDFSLALIEFERAYSYVADYRVLYNIGQVSIQLGRYARASLALRQYLREGASNIAADRTKAVAEDLKMLDGRTAHLQVTCNVQGAEVLLDDVRLAKTPILQPLLVDAGEHRLTVQKQGFITRTERLVLAGRDESSLQIDLTEERKTEPQPLQPVAPVAPPPPQQAEGRDTTESMSSRTRMLYIGAGATGLLAVGWAVSGYVGIRAAGDLHDALQRPSTEGELSSLKGKAQGWLLASDILGAATLATGATTLYFTLVGPSRDQTRIGTSRLELRFAPRRVELTGAF